jgi:hypothetical protein
MEDHIGKLMFRRSATYRKRSRAGNPAPTNVAALLNKGCVFKNVPQG